jgi:hypothetical protein
LPPLERNFALIVILNPERTRRYRKPHKIGLGSLHPSRMGGGGPDFDGGVYADP